MIVRETYVIRLGRPIDTRKGIVHLSDVPQQEPEEVAVQEAPAQRRVRLNAQPAGVEVFNQELPAFGNRAPQRGDSTKHYGYYPVDDRILPNSVAFTNVTMAEAYAVELAKKHPKVLFGIFTCVKVVETTEPTVIVKEFTDSGELTVKGV